SASAPNYLVTDAQQIVGRKRRERVSQDQRYGEGCVNSRRRVNSTGAHSFTSMAEPYVYDKAKYHYDGTFPEDLEPEQGFVHTGMFLGWIVDHDLYDTDWFGPEMRSYIDAFKNRELTGPKLFEACDGVLL